ncbi:MAG: chromosome segregation protein SMC [Acidobacteriota bacterium]
MEERSGPRGLHLHRLELLGFKSFPDKTEFVFPGGITAIIGPNGCGKSNIPDAIAWVLGEQSAKSLRAERMEDVIFKGSQSREPVNMAEVSLTMRIPAAEQKELIIARRLYRDGQSQYVMNGEVCRLRDIHDTIFDTGMGTRSYFLMEQGQISRIIDSKPTDRRLLIEEAAGVSKYRAKKHVTELKLDDSRHNLERVRDVIAEVRKTMNSLKRQAATARRYRRLALERTRLQKVLLSSRYAALAAELDAIEQRFTRMREHEAALAARLSASELDLERGDIEAVDAERRAESIRAAVYEAKLAIEKAESEIAQAKAQKTNLATQIDQRRRRLEMLGEKDRQIAEALHRRTSEVESLETELHEADGALRQALGRLETAQFGSQRLGERSREIRANQREAGLRAATIKNELLAVMSERSRLEGLENRLQQEQQRAQQRIGELDRMLVETGSRRQALEDDLSAIAARCREVSAAESSEESLLGELDARLADLDRKMGETSNRLAALNAIERGRSLVPPGVRTILGRLGEEVGARGILSDFIEVVDPGLIWPVENYLQSMLSGIVLDSSSTLAAALAAMPASGQVTFLPVDSIGAAGPGEPAPPCTPLASLVRVHPQLSAIENLFREIYIAENLDEALRLRAAFPSTSFIARKEGVSLLRSGAVLAGAPGQIEESILWIKAEIRRLEAEQDALRAEQEPLVEEERRQRARVEEIRGELAGLTAEQAETERSLLLERQQQAQGQREKSDADEHMATIALELQQAASERADALRRQEGLQASLGSVESELGAIEEELERIERAVADDVESRTALERVAGDLRTAHGRLVERHLALQTERTRVEREVAEVRSEMETCAEEMRAFAMQAELNEETRVRLEEQVVTRIRELQGREGELRSAEEAATRLREDGAQRHEAVKTLRAEHQQAAEERSRVELARAEKQRDMAHLRNAFREEFQAQPEQVLEEIGAESATADAEAVAAELEEKKAELDRMGAINLRAMEDYEQAKERYELLTAQEQDLITSIDSMVNAIQQLDIESRGRFKEAFEAINGNFLEMFKRLFGGGNAEMRVMEADDILESGIEISAQVPGKKQLPLLSLSGGEKSLTAIALLFAIFHYKPSPFCILDEADAPLDEPNTDRFLRLIQAFTARTQFILITHNVRTMQAASTLYGITMEEKGVSRQVSARLKEAVAV